MIHQITFLHARPGMSEQEFQHSWIQVQAPRYAAIPQVKRYLIDTRIPISSETAEPLFHGAAEIWFENEAEQLAVLQSREYIEGPRADEPNWTAFWRTLSLNTTDYVLLEGPPLRRDSTLIKMLVLVKRKPALPLEDFRRSSLGGHAKKDLNLPGLRRYVQCHVLDSAYAVGEAILDCVHQLWFDDVDALQRMFDSTEAAAARDDAAEFEELKYVRTLVTREHWIAGP